MVAALAQGQRYGRPCLFLARRSPRHRDPGLWELPGGKLEPGEDPGQALAREIQEELGLGLVLLGQARTYEAKIGGQGFRFHVFPVRFSDELPSRLDAHDGFGWFLPEELRSLSLAPLDAPALDDWLKAQGPLKTLPVWVDCELEKDVRR